VVAPGPAVAQRLVAELVRGTRGMISGQVYDTLGGLPDAMPEAEKLATVHRLKTGALLTAACRMGAICAQAPERSVEAITGYAQAVGLMFQVVDDLLDVTQEAAHVGKQTGKDQGKGKLTYPGLIGVDASRAEVQRLLHQAHANLRPLGAHGADLVALAEHMAGRTR
jgi:geranylgeranyl diphosphate synthase type II